MAEQARAALEIAPDASAVERTIDITTTGATSGQPRRIEIWFHRIDGHLYITGSPGKPRSWYANLKANPAFVVHVKHGVHGDVPATARPIEQEEERRRVFAGILASLPGDGDRWPELDAWVTGSPLVEFVPAD